MASLVRAMNGSPPPLGPMSRILSEEDAFRQMSPIDQLRAPSPQVGPEQAAANRQQNLRDLLSIVPGPGNVIAAEDSAQAFGDAGRYRAEGKGGKAMGSAALGMLSAFGAATGLPFGRAAGNAARGASSTAPAFPAWHGSPHDFDEFKLDKIGTGEGAQAYGHGLYFAENPKTAISYRDALEKKHQLNPQQGNLGDIRSAVDWLKSGRKGDAPSASGQHIDDAVNDLRSDYVNGPFPNPTDAQIATHLEGNFVPRGRLYHTEIDAEPHQLLDWDKPLSEQGEIGQKTIAALKDKVFGVSPSHTIGDVLSLRSRRGEDSREISAALREAGIPGIRYLDQGSRGAGGTSNYVIFDDKLVKIKGKE